MHPFWSTLNLNASFYPLFRTLNYSGNVWKFDRTIADIEPHQVCTALFCIKISMFYSVYVHTLNT